MLVVKNNCYFAILFEFTKLYILKINLDKAAILVLMWGKLSRIYTVVFWFNTVKGTAYTAGPDSNTVIATEAALLLVSHKV